MQINEIDAHMLEGGFFEGWPVAPSPEEHLALLRNSTHVVAAIEADRMIGFVTALSDRVLSAYIPLLEVLPRHRGAGIGSQLVRVLLDEIGSCYMVDVMCEAEVFPFYERLGFIAARGGVIRNYGWKTGPAAT